MILFGYEVILLTEKDIRNIFKNFIQNYIYENDILISDVAKGVDVPYNTVHGWFSGKSIPKMDKMVELSKYLDIPLVSLINMKYFQDVEKIKEYLEHSESVEDFKKNLAKNLKTLSKDKRVAQVDTAKALHLPYTSVQNWYQGKAIPTLDNLDNLANYFKVSRAGLLSEDVYSFEKLLKEEQKPQQEERHNLLPQDIKLPNYTFDMSPQIAFLKAEGAEELNEQETNELIAYLRLIKARRPKD